MIVQLVTDRRRLAPGADAAGQRRCLLRQAELAIDAGVDLIQVREPDLDAGAAVSLASAVVAAARGTRVRVVVNDRLDVAVAAGAAGVHLPARGVTAAAARSAAPDGFVIGVSVHDISDLARAHAADYVVAGTVFTTPSKPEGHATLGLEGLRAIVQRATVPVLAIGGVTAARAGEIALTGAAGVAAIGLFRDETADAGCRAASLRDRVEALRHAFGTGTMPPRSFHA